MAPPAGPPGQHVLRVPVPKSKKYPYVLVHVSSHGPKRLDLGLEATEGKAAYTLQRESLLPWVVPVPHLSYAPSLMTRARCSVPVRQDRIDDLRLKHAQCTADEWADILTALLLGQSFVDNIEITAEIGSSVILTLHKNIEGIKVRVWLLFGSWTCALG
jgi:hypothetical protein